MKRRDMPATAFAAGLAAAEAAESSKFAAGVVPWRDKRMSARPQSVVLRMWVAPGVFADTAEGLLPAIVGGSLFGPDPDAAWPAGMARTGTAAFEMAAKVVGSP